MAQQTDPRILGTETPIAIFHSRYYRNDHHLAL